MMETKDIMSGFVGLLLAAAGALPLLHGMGVGPKDFALSWFPLQFASYIIAIMGLYLLWNSVIEITNSNAIGWWSFMFAGLVMVAGIFQVLHKMNVGPDYFEVKFLKDTLYHVVFLIEGLLLMIAMFAMEL
jgi:hypothetical protein